jgi:hypothetical protein
MFHHDRKAFEAGLAAKTTREKKELGYGLINYPWNRIVRTQLLLEKDIFFGPTTVQNDVQYHWDSITCAHSVEFFDKPVALHRKSPDMKQITNVASKERLSTIWSVQLTDRILRRRGFYRKEWRISAWFKFVNHITEWSKKMVPDDHITLYNEQVRKLKLEIPYHRPASAAVQLDGTDDDETKALLALHVLHDER